MREMRGYTMLPFDAFIGTGATSYDFFLLAGGSDARAYEILRRLRGGRVPCAKVVLFDFQERLTELDSSSSKAYEECQECGFELIRVPCSIMDPSACLKSLSTFGVMIDGSTQVAIDISCFTKPYFFGILKYLKSRCGLLSVAVYYTEPSSYLLSKGLYQCYHSSSGPLTVLEMPGFPGIDTRTSRNILVILLGFDGELSSFISEEIAPEETLIVNGFPSYTPKFKDISLINNEKLLSYSDAQHKLLFARANNPFETFNVLEALRRKHPTAFLSLAPLGTKPMALGACMFAILYESVRIVYPIPEKYVSVTTEDCWQSWGYIIPLSETS